jgi:hypothetical protein
MVNASKKMKYEEKKLISLRDASKATPYSSDYLGLLVRKGKLDGEKIGGKWYTTREAMQEYIQKAAQASYEHQESLNVRIPEEEIKKAKVNLRWALLLVLITVFSSIIIWMLYLKNQDDRKSENIRNKYRITEQDGNLTIYADDPNQIKSVKVIKKE